MSDSFLSQEEVDALLEGVTGESQKSVEEVAEAGAVRNYDISSQERIVRGRMPTMEIVNERFARNFRIGLFNFIRRSPEASVGTVSVQRYSAFLRELAVPTNFNIVAIRPLRGSGLIEWHGGQRWWLSDEPAEAVHAAARAAGGHAELQAGGAPGEARAAPLPAVQAQIERRLRQTFDPHGLFTRD